MKRGVAGGGSGRPSREQLRAAVLKRFDQDKDGKLNDEERAAAHKAHEARRGSGRGGRGPRGESPGAGQGRPDREKFRAEMLKRFDKDGDGKLSDEERATARKQFEARRGGRGGRDRGGDRDQSKGDSDSSDPSKSGDAAKPDENKASEAPASDAAPVEKSGPE